MYRKVTIWPRVQVWPGPKVVALVPAVISFSTAHSAGLVEVISFVHVGKADGHFGLALQGRFPP